MPHSSEPDIRIIPAARIDREEWDTCVRNDLKALIYARSWYLDAMAGNWYGLVVNDYEAVLALPVKRLAGVTRLIYTPAFFQRLDVTGKYNNKTLYAIEQKLKSFTRLADMRSATPVFHHPAICKEQKNYILRIDRPYEEIASQYSKECRRNIGKATQRGCSFTEAVEMPKVIELYRQAYGEKASYKDKHFSRLEALVSPAAGNNHLHTWGVKDNDTDAIIFAALLLDDGNRLYYLLGAPTEEGRKARATAYFIDQVIKRFAQRRKIFDFEGSEIPAVASFYQTFSPETEFYYRNYFNKLPQPLKSIIDKKLL